MPSPKDYAAIRQVLENYIKASFTADTDLLKSVFHEQSMMSGYVDGQLDIGTPQAFYDELEASPSSKDSGEDYRAEISFIQIVGSIASAGIVEDNHLGTNYVNHFHLLKIKDDWKITSKIYQDIK